MIENPFYFFRHPFILGGNVKYTITPQTILYNRQQGLSSDVDFFPSLSCVGLACDMTEESFFYQSIHDVTSIPLSYTNAVSGERKRDKLRLLPHQSRH